MKRKSMGAVLLCAVGLWFCWSIQAGEPHDGAARRSRQGVATYNSKNRHGMKWKNADLHTCLNLISALILLVGLGGAILIYRTAQNNSSGVLGYEETGGSVYPIMPEDSKKYLRDLELYGGKANVLMDELRGWFVGLWHGKSLAFTVACITIMVSFIVFYAANHLPTRIKSDIPSENNRDGTD